MWLALGLALALAADATAVGFTLGATSHTTPRPMRYAIPVSFGVFQGGMAVAGWQLAHLGSTLAPTLLTPMIYRSVGAGLLLLVALMMLREGITSTNNDTQPPPHTIGRMLVLSVATSIDAMSAGVSLPLLPLPPLYTGGIIAAITLITSGLAVGVGRLLKRRVEPKRLLLAGGILLLALAGKLAFW